MKHINLARPKIQAIKAYTPGARDHQGLLLDANERSTPPLLTTQTAFSNTQKLHRYPDYQALSSGLARYAGVDSSEVLPTNGSDQAIDIVFRTFTESNSRVIIPTPSFAMFHHGALLADNTIVTPYYHPADLAFPIMEVREEIKTPAKLIVICNPNNPTGTLVDVKTIEQLARSAPQTIIFIDEAYFEFAGVTAIPLVAEYPNIVVTRTFSKAFGLAALRIGYIVASKIHIAEMLKVRGPYSVNLPAAETAQTALANPDEAKTYAHEIMTKSKPLLERFFAHNNLAFYPSAANFILFRPPNAKEVYVALRQQGIFVRLIEELPLQNTIRVSIGTVQETKQFIAAYERILGI